MKSRLQKYNIDLGLDMDTTILSIKLCPSLTMLMSIKQQLSNIWSSIHDRVKEHWGWAGKKVFLIKKRIYSSYLDYLGGWEKHKYYQRTSF